MIDPKKAASILYKHFEEVTTEQFQENLQKYCPFVFEDEEENFQKVNSQDKINDPKSEVVKGL
jgi:hypothetical protein